MSTTEEVVNMNQHVSKFPPEASPTSPTSAHEIRWRCDELERLEDVNLLLVPDAAHLDYIAELRVEHRMMRQLLSQALDAVVSLETQGNRAVQRIQALVTELRDSREEVRRLRHSLQLERVTNGTGVEAEVRVQ